MKTIVLILVCAMVGCGGKTEDVWCYDEVASGKNVINNRCFSTEDECKTSYDESVYSPPTMGVSVHYSMCEER